MGKISFLVGAAALGLVSTVAHAQQTPGWYIGAQADWTHLNGASSSFNNGTATLPFTANSSSGFGGGLLVGYEWPFGMSLEGEAIYRNSTYSTFTTPNAAGTFPLGGSAISMAFMGNVLYDFLPNSRWTPYIGGGVGISAFGVDSLQPTALGIQPISDTLWHFAYQGIAGVKFALSPQVSINLDYRYFSIVNPTFNPMANTQLKTQYGSNNVILGIAFHLAAQQRQPSPP